METPPSRAHVSETLRRSHELGAEFLIADLELALAFLERGALSDDRDTCTRNLENGRKALRTVEGFLGKLDLDEEHRARVMTLRQELERRLGVLSS